MTRIKSIAGGLTVMIATTGAVAAGAQTVTVNPGGVTVKEPSGKTTRINNGGIATGGGKSAGAVQKSGSTVSISGNDKNTTVNVRGGTVLVSGNHNKVTVRGRCASLAVSGNNNQITGLNVVSLTVSGNTNTVRWQSSPNKNGKPNITQTGNNNSVMKK